MPVIDQLTEDLNKALKGKDEVASSTLRMAIANLTNARIAKGSDLTDEEAIEELGRDAKRHKESIAAFESGGRPDLSDKEKAELEVLSRYLPEQLSEDDITKVVDEVVSQVNPSGPADMGKVMSGVMAKLKGQADGSVVSSIVRERLTKI